MTLKDRILALRKPTHQYIEGDVWMAKMYNQALEDCVALLDDTIESTTTEGGAW